MKKLNSSYTLILFIFSFALTYDVYWEPENPKIGESLTIYINVLNDSEYKNTYPLYVHIKSMNILNTEIMSLNYSKGPSVWSYTLDLDNSFYFYIDNKVNANKDFDNFTFISSEIKKVDSNKLFYNALLLISNKEYSKALLLLEDIIYKYKNKEIAAEAEYIIAEIYLNDFNDYSAAAHYYTKILDSYPKTFNIVKKSMFTLAYIYANNLDSYSDAIYFYELFKKEYPEDELLPSIDYELLGLYKHKLVIESLLNSTKQ